MKVFISWSGDRSRQVAKELHEWLPDVVQDVEPWMSDVDIAAGMRSIATIAKALAHSNFGICCLTSDNATAPWLLFEAGALSKFHEESRVCTYLLDLNSVEVKPPLSQFQYKAADEAGTKGMIQSINSVLAKPLASQRLDRAFDLYWPRLRERLEAIRASAETQEAERDLRDIAKETLETVRSTGDLQIKVALALADMRRELAAAAYAYQGLTALRQSRSSVSTASAVSAIAHPSMSGQMTVEPPVVPEEEPPNEHE